MGKAKNREAKVAPALDGGRPPAAAAPLVDGVLHEGPRARGLAVPNDNEYSISNVNLTQNGQPVGRNVSPNMDLNVSGIASPAGNSASIQISIPYLDANGQLQQAFALLRITFDVNTGAWSTTILASTLATISGRDGYLEITENGPIPGDTCPVTQRPIHVN